MAGGTNFPVDLETSAETAVCQFTVLESAGDVLRLVIKSLEVLCMFPWVLCWVETAQVSNLISKASGDCDL